jgi:glycosyltransferase involved in cell wall biosynthesis
VLCSRAASLPEVGGDAVIYFDPFSAEDIAEKISGFISDSSLYDDLRARGRMHAAQFTWEKTARQVLDFLVH